MKKILIALLLTIFFLSGCDLIKKNVAPVINAENSYNVEVGDDSFDLIDFISISDEEDGDISVIPSMIDYKNFDINIVGTYDVSIEVSDSKGELISKEIIINIVDTTLPVITISEETEINVEVKTIYTDQLPTVTDNYDESLTIILDDSALDMTTLGTYKISYNSTDSSGNRALEVIKTINVVDTTAPTVALVGSIHNYMTVDGIYIEPGLTIEDNYYTEDFIIEIVGEVDVTTIGDYEITYSVSDSSENVSETLTRTITVIEESIPLIKLDGEQEITLEYLDTYTEANATITFSYGLFNMEISGDIVDTNTLGTYEVMYRYTDIDDLEHSLIRIVNIVDTTNPIINVNEIQNIFETGSDQPDWTKYFNISDNVDKSIVVIEEMLDLSLVDMSSIGSFFITANYTDLSGNLGDEVSISITITEEWTDDSYFTYYKSDSYVTVAGYSLEGPKDVVIPCYIDGLPVKNITDSAFSNMGLTSVGLPLTLITIGRSAFHNNLLTELTIPEGIKVIPDYAFNSNSISELSLPDSLEIIEGRAFDSNPLTSFHFPKNLKQITYWIFNNGSNIVSFTVDPENPYFELVDGVVYSEDMSTVIMGPRNYYNQYYVIPEGVTKIQNAAFYHMGLRSISLPDSLEIIEEWAFAGNYDLTVINIGPNVREIGDWSIVDNSKISNFYVDETNQHFSSLDGVLYNKDMTELIIFPPNYFASSYTMPDTIISIRDASFIMSNLTSIILSNSINTIPDYAFYKGSLTSLFLPDSIQIIGRTAFERNELASVEIPNTVTEIQDSAFQNNNITSITIPESVVYIGRSAFNLNPLTEVVILGDETRFNEDWEDIGFPLNLMPSE